MITRKLIRRIVPYILFLTVTNSLRAQCPASSPLVINSVVPTASSCQASGTATVSASGGSTPYTYSIVAGPSTAPAQSSSVFSSLAPGTYTVKVIDNCNTPVTASVTVTGSYAVPSPSATTQPTSCPNSGDGSLTISVTDGLGPFSYSLVSPSPLTVGPQAGNVFTGLPAGTYTYQVTDACGNFQTRTAAVGQGSPGTANINASLQYVACDSFTENVSVYAPDFKPPYSLSFTLPDGRVMTATLPASAFGSGFAQVNFNFRYHHTAGSSDPMQFTVTSNCGSSYSASFPMSIYQDMSVLRNDPSGCGSGYSYTLDPLAGFGAHCSTLVYSLIGPAGDTLARQTNNSTFGGYPPGNGYKVARQDCCGTDVITFNWDPPPSYSFITPSGTTAFGACKENTTVEFLQVTANYTKSIVLVSGPPSVTFLDGTVHTYTYPDTIQDPNANTNVVYLSGLTAGTYKVYDLDICGGKDSTTFVITPFGLRKTTFSAAAKPSCGGGGKIVFNVASSVKAGSISVNSSTVFGSTPAPFVDSVTGLSPGVYDVAYQYYNGLSTLPLAYPSGMASLGCDIIKDTVVVAGYAQPVFASTPAVANCGATRDVALLPDSASGLQPYTFKIIAGPSTTAAQSSPVFPGLTAGTYAFQMADACGNSYTSNISIDTLAVPNAMVTGGTCKGSAALITLPVTPFNSYTWQHPDGTTTTGDTLSLNPITNADTGTYTITATSTIGGCTSTSSKNLTLGFCAVLQETLLRFDGQQKDGDIRLSWQAADQAGISNYTIERSTDGVSFTPVQQVAAASAEEDSYRAVDRHVPSGVVYYRLQMASPNGVVNYSQTISFNVDRTSSFSLRPTLITDNTPVTCAYPAAGSNGCIRVVGVDGRVYRTIPAPAGSTAGSIDFAGLVRGSYFVIFTRNDTTVPTQVWKE